MKKPTPCHLFYERTRFCAQCVSHLRVRMYVRAYVCVCYSACVFDFHSCRNAGPLLAHDHGPVPDEERRSMIVCHPHFSGT